jgi:hypothetical protein
MTTNDPRDPYGSSPTPPPMPPPWAGPPGYGPTQPAPEQKSWLARHKVLTAVLAVLGVFVVLTGIGAAVGGGGTDPKAVGSSAPSRTAKAPAPADPTTAAETTPASTKAPAPKPPTEPKLTKSQEQAIGAAKDYLDISGFSRLGLIDQLSSSAGSGFSKADATFAVDYLKVDWKEQAVRSAKSYLDITHFSRAGLIEQLSSAAGGKFTKAEATYAADQVGL